MLNNTNLAPSYSEFMSKYASAASTASTCTKDNSQLGILQSNGSDDTKKYSLCAKNVPVNMDEREFERIVREYGKIYRLNKGFNVPYWFIDCMSQSDMESILKGMERNRFNITVDIKKAKKNEIKNISHDFSRINEQPIQNSNINNRRSDLANRKLKNFGENPVANMKYSFDNLGGRLESSTGTPRTNSTPETRDLKETLLREEHDDSKKVVYEKLSEEFESMSKGTCKLCGIVCSKYCERCHAHYCSVRCQTKHWSQHQFYCFRMPSLVEPENFLSSNRNSISSESNNLNSIKITQSENKEKSGNDSDHNKINRNNRNRNNRKNENQNNHNQNDNQRDQNKRNQNKNQANRNENCKANSNSNKSENKLLVQENHNDEKNNRNRNDNQRDRNNQIQNKNQRNRNQNCKENSNSNKSENKFLAQENHNVEKQIEKFNSVVPNMNNRNVNEKISYVKPTPRADPPPSASKVIMLFAYCSDKFAVRSADSKHSEDYTKILNIINGSAEVAKTLSSLPKRHSYCITDYEGIYCRAIVDKVISDIEIHVIYVDFGNAEVRKLSELKELLPQLHELTRYPFEVRLKNLENLTTTGNMQFKMLTTELIDNSVQMKLIFDENDKNGYVISNAELIKVQTNESINNEILKCLSFTTPNDNDEQIMDTEIIIEEIEIELNMKLMVLDVSMIEDGILVCIPDNLYPHLKLFDDQLKKYATSSNKGTSPRPNEMCVAEYKEGVWRRAKCYEVVGDGNSTLEFIDYGDACTINITKIRKYPKNSTFPCRTHMYEISEAADLVNGIIDLKKRESVVNLLKELVKVHDIITPNKILKKGTYYSIELPSVVDKIRKEIN